ncbi:tetratricopeptide repeat protein [Anthocerotibacter panamensis]|uniref:tetratricopeptide repeat protein n=1 Tax=Anthocerotibacter panamensis TaxID=2857077 RepID=UPI001C402E71|nr:tetratricopeptide repeat protein [Anthocerotibacter panamensis]
MFFILRCLGLLLLGATQVAQALPFRPTADGQVLERLRTNPTDPVYQELRALRAKLAQSPQDLALAVHLAQRYIEQGRILSDPRYNGYAQAVLAPWWNQPEPPPEVLVLRATLRQSAHDFPLALADLDRVLKQNPDDPQALITRATILQVQGDYPEAKRACAHLFQHTTDLVLFTCLGGVAGLNGQAHSAVTLLQQGLTRSPQATTGEKNWALTTLAEIYQRLGQSERAEVYFKQALALVPDSYLLGAYADFLLDQGRAKDVVALLHNQTRADGLLLRLTLAEKVLKSTSFPQHLAALQDRFAASRLRKDSSHRREEARFTLHLLNQPRAALELAVQNWQVQREPADARLVLQTALASGDRKAAQPALQWLKESRLEDVQLAQLQQQLEVRP